MSHVTVDLDGVIIEVFNTELAARLWLKHQDDPCRVIVRGKSYFQRVPARDESGYRPGTLEMKIWLNATRCEQNARLLDAANDLAFAVEDRLEKMAEAALAHVVGQGDQALSVLGPIVLDPQPIQAVGNS